MSKDLLADMSIRSSARSPCKPQKGDCGKKACCTEASSIDPKGSAALGMKCNDDEKSGCCVGEPLSNDLDQSPGTLVAKLKGSSKTGCSTKIAYAAAPDDHH